MVSKFYWLGYQTTRKQTSNFFYIEFLTWLAPTGCLSGSCLTWKGLIIGGLKPLKGTTPLNRATTDSESQELSYHEHWLHNEAIILQVSLCIRVVCDEFLNFSKFSISRQIFHRTICVFCTVFYWTSWRALKTLPKALRTQGLTTLTSCFGWFGEISLVGSVW